MDGPRFNKQSLSEELPATNTPAHFEADYFACLVIFIHMGLANVSAFVPCVVRQAVPFFFLVSGFFFEWNASRCKNALPYAAKYARSILLVYAVWALLWLPYFTTEAVSLHGDRGTLYVIAVVLRRILLAGIAPYWYLLVSAEGVLILALIMHRKAYWLGWGLTVLGLFFLVLFDLRLPSGPGRLISQAFYTVFSWNCNVVMTGFPMLFLGAAFSRHENWLKPLKRVITGPLYLLSILLAFYIYRFSPSLYGIPFGLIQACFLFLFCISPTEFEFRIPHSVCRAARNLSSVIYLTHMTLLPLFGSVFHIWILCPGLRCAYCLPVLSPGSSKSSTGLL